MTMESVCLLPKPRSRSNLSPLLVSQVLAKVEGSVPLMEIQLELVASEIVWKPELTEGKVSTSVRDMVRYTSTPVHT